MTPARQQVALRAAQVDPKNVQSLAQLERGGLEPLTPLTMALPLLLMMLLLPSGRHHSAAQAGRQPR